MKKKTILKYLTLILLILISIIVGYTLTNNKRQEELLKKELIKLVEKDLVIDNYDIKIKTKGEYAKIEKKLKKHYKELSNNIKTINSYLDNQDLINILSLDNIKNNAPNFENSYNLINDVKDKLNSSITIVSNLSSEESIKEILDDKELDYIKEELKELSNIKEENQIIVDNLNIFLNKVEEILNLLKNNTNNWYIKDNQLYFKTNKLVNEYNNLYNDLNTFVKDKFSKYNKITKTTLKTM